MGRLYLFEKLCRHLLEAFPIVSLISMLVGLILASVGTLGTIQLKMFGSQIFVADAVTIGMLRVMDAIMTGRFMVGRYQNRFAKK